MESKELFAAGLGLPWPWFIEKVYLEGDEDDLILHIHVDHKRRTKFKYNGNDFPVYDHQERTWKHLNFFQHKCHLHARVPRVKLPNGKVKLVEVPWANPGSSFSLLFEYDVIKLVQEGMSASGVGRRLEIGAKRVFGIIRRHVSYALTTQQIDVVKELSVDETSSRKGHNYFTILADRKVKKVVGVSIGKDKNALAHALVDMEVRGGDRKLVRTVTMDMSRSYISGTNEYMRQADISFDRFHIAAQMNKAVDLIRRQDRKEYEALKNSRYLWLKNSNKLTPDQKIQVDQLSKAYPNIGTAYRLKELLKNVLDHAYVCKKITPLNEWMKEAWKSGLKPIQKFINMLKEHWYGVKCYFQKLATNAYAERVNLKIQEIKRIAKGFANSNNFITMIYFHLGGLKFKPTKFD